MNKDLVIEPINGQVCLKNVSKGRLSNIHCDTNNELLAATLNTITSLEPGQSIKRPYRQTENEGRLQIQVSFQDEDGNIKSAELK